MVKKYFKNINGQTVDIVEFCQQKCTNNTTLYVGTDSVVTKDKTAFVVVVAIRFGKPQDKTAKGGTFCYLIHKVPRHKDKLERLRQEADVTMEMVQYLEDNYIPVDIVEFDYNSDPSHDSNKVIDQVGWATGLGYKITVKPDEQVAVKAADHICREKNLKERKRKK